MPLAQRPRLQARFVQGRAREGEFLLAALDETNIDRFCTVLEDFLGGSQFLVVTHARRTMSYADTLYGITMQEHGVSRALSLSLREYDEHGAAGNQGTRAARVAEAAAAAEAQSAAGQ